MPRTDSRSLVELIRTVRRRTMRASEVIAATYDPDVVDREIRYIRPFWEYFTHRRRLSNAAYWRRRGRDVFAGIAEPHFDRTPLVWMPRRAALVAAVGEIAPPARKRLLHQFASLDGAMFNFVGLAGRMRHTLGLGDDESFHVVTTEEAGRGYELLYRILHREGADGLPYRILTCQYRLPSGTGLKIEKDYSERIGDPVVAMRFTGKRSDPAVRFDGRQSELRSTRGGTLRVA